MIKHIWFDVAETLVRYSAAFTTAHNALRYQTYADATNRRLTDSVKQEYATLLTMHGSNSAVFRSLGLSSDYWQRHYDELDGVPYIVPNPAVAQTLQTLRTSHPISIFTNWRPETLIKNLDAIHVELRWFTHVIAGDDVAERKPALDGFYEMIRRSRLPANQLLYVGDRVAVDIRPAKQAGMQTALVWATSPEADYSCERFVELIDVVRQTSQGEPV